ncbi:chemotaxis locus anti-sigma factor antagonist [Chitinimonas prasina]|uniref:Chemotaxis locus anti-sigma factor antagonist n=1 Tax=Chitinimonas prasina TaxID=1434937 RepID=A0ABQ5YLW7_9NEIS|nr:STAS domain-containing protein [Chitinimonas prasina]GLR14973.1 chemotaxis locus anti-sigma factor antagonist [Chitinimonas prasina]
MGITSNLRGDRLIVTVEGRFNFDLHPAFNAATAAVGKDKSIAAIDINLYEISYIDSSALGMLLVLREAALKAGIKDLNIVGSHGAVRQVLDIAHFEKFYTLN